MSGVTGSVVQFLVNNMMEPSDAENTSQAFVIEGVGALALYCGESTLTCVRSNGKNAGVENPEFCCCADLRLRQTLWRCPKELYAIRMRISVSLEDEQSLVICEPR